MGGEFELELRLVVWSASGSRGISGKEEKGYVERVERERRLLTSSALL